nr:hypothetical protein GCM10020092_022150 [Actinoplanes digitatis]
MPGRQQLVEDHAHRLPRLGEVPARRVPFGKVGEQLGAGRQPGAGGIAGHQAQRGPQPLGRGGGRLRADRPGRRDQGDGRGGVTDRRRPGDMVRPGPRRRAHPLQVRRGPRVRAEPPPGGGRRVHDVPHERMPEAEPAGAGHHLDEVAGHQLVQAAQHGRHRQLGHLGEQRRLALVAADGGGGGQQAAVRPDGFPLRAERGPHLGGQGCQRGVGVVAGTGGAERGGAAAAQRVEVQRVSPLRR